MKVIKKIPIISLVAGILIAVYALLAFFIEKGFFNLTDVVGRVVIGVGMITFAVMILMPKFMKKTNFSSSALRITEFIVIILAAILGFILPAFGTETINLGSGSLWLGITLVMYGGIELFLGSVGKAQTKGWKFFASLGAVIVGAYIFGANFVDKNIKVATFVLMLVAAAYLITLSVITLSSKKQTK